jgi:CHASE2 domain-containing sensor protein
MHAEALGYARAMAGWFFVVAGALGLALGIFVDGWTWLAIAAMFIGLAGESLTRGRASGRKRPTHT